MSSLPTGTVTFLFTGIEYNLVYAEFNHLYAEGCTMTVEQAIALALEE